jgi:5-hydroxyisourate hydrolase-like protein (transthyretin family)
MNKLKHFYLIFLPAVIAIILIGYACQENATTPAKPTGEIAGQILDEQDVPVPGAIIQLFTTTGIQGLIDKDTTDEDGFFKLSGMPERQDNLKMRIEHEDFTPFESPVTEILKGKDNKKVPVKLLHDSTCTGVLEINAKNVNGELLQNVEIRLNRENKIIRKALTKENGKFVFENVCDGEYWLRLAKQGYKVIEQSLKIENGESKTMDFEMLFSEDDTCCNGKINLTILDSLTGNPIQYVKGRLWKGSDKIREATTDADGKIVFERICKGEFQISLFAEGYYGEEFKITMDCNETKDITKLLLKKTNSDSCCNGVVYIFAKDSATNAAIPNVLCKIWKDGKLLSDKRTSESGMASFTGLCPGKYSFSMQHEKYGAKEFNLELKCNDTIEISKTLIQSQGDSCCNGQIVLSLKDKDNKESISNATVRLWKDGKLVTKKISEGGYAKFTNVCIGNYVIDVVHEKYKGIEFEVKVECNATVSLTKELERNSEQDSCCNGVVIVAPMDKETKKIIYGAKVKLYFGDKIVFQETAKDAPLVIKNLCKGKYQFTFIAEGYKSVEEMFTLECNDTLEYPYYMQRMEQDTCCDGRLVVIPKDSATGEVLNGTKVRVWRDGKVVKDGIVEGGMIVFEKMCKGMYSLSFYKEGYKESELSITFDCNEEKTVTRNLVKLSDIPCCNGKVTLKALDKETGLIIKGAVIKLMQDGKVISQKTQEGEYVVFEKLCQGNYHVVIMAENYEAVEFNFELGCDQITGFEKTMTKKNNDCCKGNLYISVKDSTNNNPLAGIEVKLYQGDSKKAYGTTSDGGVIKFYNVCEGNYVLVLTGSKYNGREIPLVVGCNDTLELGYRLKAKENVDTCNTAEIYLIVKDSSGTRIPGAAIKIYNVEGKVIAEGTSNEDGVFVYSSLKAPAKYKIQARKEGYNDPYITVEWSKCERKEAYIIMKRNG